MKRAGNLIDAIASIDNLYLAWTKTIRGKQEKSAVLRFRERFHDNIYELSAALRRGTKRWGPYYCFTIHDPKERVIKVAPLEDRIAYHAIMNVCEPVFERQQIFDSYACRKGKGQFAALERAKEFSRKSPFFLKLDARKYFDSISHEALKSKLERLFKDPTLLRLFFNLIDSYESTPGCGIPIGSLTSQFFANAYLSYLDHFVHEELRCGKYVRYMDDILLWGEREALKGWFRRIDEYCREELRISLKPFVLNRSGHGVSFLGYRVLPGRLLASPRSKKRFAHKIREALQEYLAGRLAEDEFLMKLQTLVSFLSHADTVAFRRRVLRENGLCP